MINLKLKFLNILAHYRSESLALIIHLICIFLFGAGLASKSNFTQEYSTFILFYAGFISIFNSLDLGYTLVIAKGERLYFIGLIYIFIISILLSSLASIILDLFMDINTQLYLIILYLIIGFLLNIVRSLFDRLKWFVLGTFFGNHFLLSITVIPAFLYSPKSFSEWWTINVLFSGFLLFVAIMILFRSKKIKIHQTDKLNESFKQLRVNWKMSVIYFQGNLSGRIDRFLYPFLFCSDIPAVILLVNESAHRLLFLTTSAIRFNIPEYGQGNRKFVPMSITTKFRVLMMSILINSSIIFGTIFLVNKGSFNILEVAVVIVYALSGSIVVLSQYVFFGLIINKSYNVIIQSQILGMLTFTIFILVSNANLFLVSCGYLGKCFVEYVVLSRVDIKRLSNFSNKFFGNSL